MATIVIDLPVHTGFDKMEMKIWSTFVLQCLKDQYPGFQPTVRLVDENTLRVEVKDDSETKAMEMENEITAAVPKWYSEWKPHLIMSGIPVWFGEKQWK